MAVTLTSSYQLICSIDSSTYSKFRVYGKLDSQDISNNTSSISIQTRIYGNGGKGSWATGSVATSVSNSANSPMTTNTGAKSYSKGSETTLATQIFTISHNADGTYTNKSISSTLSTSASPSGTASGTINVPTIPRASQPTASPNPVDVGASTLINFNQASSTFTHDISLTFGTINWNIGTGYTNQVILQIPTTFYDEFTSTERQKNATFTCVTKSGSTTIGTKTLTIGIKIPDSSSPTYSNVSKAETDADVISAIGSSMSEAILGLSKPRYQMTLASQNGATLSSATIKCGDLTNTIALSSSSYSLDYTFQNAMTSNVVQIIITDSRGLQTTYTDTYSTYQVYENPTITYQSVSRTDLNGEVGIYLTGTMQPENIDGVTANSISGAYRYKENSESATWSSLITLPNATYNQENTEWTINYTSDSQHRWALYNKSWIVEITIADGSTPNTPQTRTYTINKAVPTISLGETDLQVNGDLYVADEDGQNARNVLEDIGDLTTLTTTNQDSLVDAVNEINSKTSKLGDFMLIANSSNQTFSSASTITLWNANTNARSNGTKLTFDSANHAIKIGAGVSLVEVSGGIYFSTAGSAGTKNVYVYIKRGNAEAQVARAIKHISNNYESLHTQPKIIEVQENDLITLRVNSQTGTTTVASADSGGVSSGLQVKVIG